VESTAHCQATDPVVTLNSSSRSSSSRTRVDFMDSHAPLGWAGVGLRVWVSLRRSRHCGLSPAGLGHHWDTAHPAAAAAAAAALMQFKLTARVFQSVGPCVAERPSHLLVQSPRRLQLAAHKWCNLWRWQCCHCTAMPDESAAARVCQVLSSSSGHVAFPAQNFVCSITYLSICLPSLWH
jgi:hypothetical protein